MTSALPSYSPSGRLVKQWEQAPSVGVVQEIATKAVRAPWQMAGAALDLARRSWAPVPETPDNLSPDFVQAASDAGTPVGLARTIMNQLRNRTLARDSWTLLSAVVQVAGGPLNDRKFLLEHIIRMLTELEPTNNALGTNITNILVTALWHDLPKPPRGWVGSSKYRSADGSGNNPFQVELGMAGKPYARSVPPMHPMPTNLPDAGLVFDTLLARPEGHFYKHPNSISSLLYNFATLIIHTLFNTSRADANINESSSYLDLSIIYGNNQEEQNKVRTFSKGKLQPDIVSNLRLFLMPPAITALAVIFSRNHNLIAERLLEINESGRFSPQANVYRNAVDAEEWIDEQLFQTARLVNCGWFLQVVFADYIAVILGENFTESTWRLVPTGPIPGVILSTEDLPRGTGNAVSIEFNMLYRWHAILSEADTKWAIDLAARYTDKKPQELNEADFITIYTGEQARQGDDPTKWNIPGLQRQADGTFKDQDLVKLLTNATNNVAGEFGARRLPSVMRVIDIAGIQTARSQWGAASLNEFRRFLGLTEYTSFEQWNPHPEIAEQAARLYTHVDNLELYPGLLAEDTKPVFRPGSGLCPGYTISRAILSDATALVRGDRYFAQDYNSGNLSTWAFEDVTPDPNGGSHGGIIGRLLMRVLPEYYTYNSIYALFPFTTPEQTIEILEGQGKLERYDTKPPIKAPMWRKATTHANVKGALTNKKGFSGVYYQDRLGETQLPVFMRLLNLAVRAWDDPNTRVAQKRVLDDALFVDAWKERTFTFVLKRANEFAKSESWSIPDKYFYGLDVLRDVFVPASVELVAHQFGFPLKTQKTPRGAFTAEELYLLMVDCHTFVYSNFDPAEGFSLREDAYKSMLYLRYIINRRMIGIANVPGAVRMLTRIAQDLVFGRDLDYWVPNPDATQFYKRLLSSHRPHEELLENVLATVISSTIIPYTAIKVVDFYLRAENAEHLQRLHDLCKQDNFTEHDRTLLLRYMLEALRLSPSISNIVRRAKTSFDSGPSGEPTRAGDLINCDLAAVGRDGTVFTDPEVVKLDRPMELYSISGRGAKANDNTVYNHVAVLGLLKSFFSLATVERAEGPAGHLNPVSNPHPPHFPLYMTPRAKLSPFPTNFSIMHTFDRELSREDKIRHTDSRNNRRAPWHRPAADTDAGKAGPWGTQATVEETAALTEGKASKKQQQQQK